MHPSIKAVIFGLDFHTCTEGVNRPSLKVNKAETWSVAFIFLGLSLPSSHKPWDHIWMRNNKETYFLIRGPVKASQPRPSLYSILLTPPTGLHRAEQILAWRGARFVRTHEYFFSTYGLKVNYWLHIVIYQFTSSCLKGIFQFKYKLSYTYQTNTS